MYEPNVKQSELEGPFINPGTKLFVPYIVKLLSSAKKKRYEIYISLITNGLQLKPI